MKSQLNQRITLPFNMTLLTYKNGLKLNKTKCKVLHLGNNNSKLPADNSVTLEKSTHERDLDMLVDNNLTFDDHITQCQPETSYD